MRNQWRCVVRTGVNLGNSKCRWLTGRGRTSKTRKRGSFQRHFRLHTTHWSRRWTLRTLRSISHSGRDRSPLPSGHVGWFIIVAWFCRLWKDSARLNGCCHCSDACLPFWCYWRLEAFGVTLALQNSEHLKDQYSYNRMSLTAWLHPSRQTTFIIYIASVLLAAALCKRVHEFSLLKWAVLLLPLSSA